MCFKKKKVVGEVYTEDRKCILLSAQEIDVLKVLDRKKLYDKEFTELKDQLLFLSPRDNADVYEIDRKIKDKIGDLKLILNKDHDADDVSIMTIIENIIVMIKERDAKELK